MKRKGAVLRRQKERGAVLFMVLVLMGVLGLFGVGALKSGIGQLQIVNFSVLFDRKEQAVDAAMTCVLSQFILHGAGELGQQVIALNPQLTVSPGKMTTGCSRNVMAAGPQYIQFNNTVITALNQYCGRGSSTMPTGSDLEFFSTHKYLLSAASYDPSGRRETAALHQAWALELPVDMQALEVEGVTEAGDLVTHKAACHAQIALFNQTL